MCLCAFRDTRYELPNIWELICQAYVEKSLPEIIKKMVGPVRHATDTKFTVVDALGLASLNLPPVLDGIYANMNKTQEAFAGIKKGKCTVDSCVDKVDMRLFIEAGVVVHGPSVCLIHQPLFVPSTTSSAKDGSGFQMIGVSRVIDLVGL
jgi:hypothetical protein